MKCSSLLILTSQNGFFQFALSTIVCIQSLECFFRSSGFGFQKNMFTDEVRNELFLRMASMELSWNTAVFPVRG